MCLISIRFNNSHRVGKSTRGSDGDRPTMEDTSTSTGERQYPWTC